MSSLYIPIRNSFPPECVRVDVASLPADPTDLIGVLTNELAPPSLWLRFALEYLSAGAAGSYLELLSAITAEDATAAYSHPAVASPQYAQDRIAILCSLAGYETFTGWQQREGGSAEERRHSYQLAIEHLNAATELDYTQALTWVGKGLLLLVQADVDAALQAFNSAIANDRSGSNALALVGKAVCLYHKAAYAAAARLFTQALTVNPELDCRLLLGLALCYHQCKDVAAAVRVLRRLLDKDGSNVDALCALAVIQLNEAAEQSRQQQQEQRAAAPAGTRSPARSSVSQALRLLGRAYCLNPRHPSTLLLLCSHLFLQRRYAAVQTLAQRALAGLDLSERGLRSEAFFQLARVHHAQLEYAQAAHFYQLAKTENEDMQRRQQLLARPQPAPASAASASAPPAAVICSHPLVSLGCAQMLLARGEYSEARLLLAGLLASHPADADVLRLLGWTQLRLRCYREAEALLARAAAMSPQDVELLCDWGSACEQVEGKRKEAKAAYTEAIRLMREAQHSPPFQLLNNLGVLCQEIGEAEEAQRWYSQALQALRRQEQDEQRGERKAGAEEEGRQQDEAEAALDGSGGVVTVASLTLRYNLALLQEQSSPSAPLSDLCAPYAALAAAFPSYLDASLRVGSLHLSRGSYEAALASFQSVLSLQERHLECRTLLGSLLQRRGQWRRAEREYQRIAQWTASGTVAAEGGRQLDAGGGGGGGGDEDEEEEGALKGDTYAKLALAGLYLAQARLLKAATDTRQAKAALQLKVTRSMAAAGAGSSQYWTDRAGKYFASVLASDRLNLFAAHGLACLLAEAGELAAAKDALMAVREARDGFLDVQLNLGHVLTAQGQYAAAVKTYEAVLSKALPSEQLGADGELVEQQRVDAFHYLARACYLGGQLEAAVLWLDECVRRRGEEALCWYNRALAQEEFAICVLRRRVEERALHEVEAAVQRLSEAESAFLTLEEAARLQPSPRAGKEADRQQPQQEADEDDEDGKEEPPAAAAPPHLRLSGSPLRCPAAASLSLAACARFPLLEKARAHAAFCRATLVKAAAHLAAAQRRESELKAMADSAKRARAEAEERERLQQEQREEQQRLEVEKAEQLARELKARLQGMQESWQTQSRQDRDRGDEDEADAEEPAAGGDRRRRQRGRQQQADDDGGRRKGKRRRTDDESEQPQQAAAAATADSEAGSGPQPEVEQQQDGEQEEEWRRLREQRRLLAGYAAPVAPAAESSSEGAEADGRAAAGGDRRRRLMRRAATAAAAEAEEKQTEAGHSRDDAVRGLDEEEGEAEAEAAPVPQRGAERRPAAAGRRKAIVEDEGDGAEEEGQPDGAETEGQQTQERPADSQPMDTEPTGAAAAQQQH